MREALFIKRNAKKWQEYQHFETDDPDEKADRFITLVDDLSYAKTFYPHGRVTKWINSLAVSTYQSVYQNRKQSVRKIFDFWKFELPLLFRKYHKVLLFTFTFFAVFCAIAVYSSSKDGNFVRGVLGDGYVNMTEENIANGDPFGVYKDNSPFNMFVTIAYNNLRVDFLMFLFGIFFGIGTLWLLFQNSMMLGCFQYMFFAKGLGMQSVLVIWIHGTLEISAMIIASTAGFILARGFLMPGSLKRIDSFTKSARDAVKIIICLVPITLTAAFLEGYITHLMSQSFDRESGNFGLPVWASISILTVSLVFIVWYFIIYPIQLERKQKSISTPQNKLFFPNT
ncbi:MAG: stage II sporulation protein M [Chitinophagaceae bacterium]